MNLIFLFDYGQLQQVRLKWGPAHCISANQRPVSRSRDLSEPMRGPHTAEAREEPGPGSQLASGEQIAWSVVRADTDTGDPGVIISLASDMRQHLSSAVMASAD